MAWNLRPVFWHLGPGSKSIKKVLEEVEIDL